MGQNSSTPEEEQGGGGKDSRCSVTGHDDSSHVSCSSSPFSVVEPTPTALSQAQRSLLLPKPSTPAQWKAAFRSSTNKELRSLLVDEEEEEVDPSNTTNGQATTETPEDDRIPDLTPLGFELKRTAQRIREYRKMETAVLGTNNDDAGVSTVSFYKAYRNRKEPSSEEFDEDDELIDLCKRILRASSIKPKLRPVTPRKTNDTTKPPHKPIPTLSKLRTKLVPSRMKEHVFWECLWVVLYDRKQQRNSTKLIQSVDRWSHETTDLLDAVESSNDLRTERLADLEERLEGAVELVTELLAHHRDSTRRLGQSEALVEKIWEMHQAAPPAAAAATASNAVLPSNGTTDSTPMAPSATAASTQGSDDKASQTTPAGEGSSSDGSKAACKTHPGTWKISKDSLEFLAFPSEAKEALRTEKQKRLKRVREELLFILDSDDPKDSHGEWSCCHKTSYTAECGCTGG